MLENHRFLRINRNGWFSPFRTQQQKCFCPSFVSDSPRQLRQTSERGTGTQGGHADLTVQELMPDLSQDHTAASPLPQPSNFYYNEKVLMSQHVTFRALLPVYRSCWCQLGSATCPPVPSRWETSRQPLNNESQKC